MKIKKICMLGSTGFVGRHLATRLANSGYKLRILSRHPQRRREVEVLPNAELVGADIHNPKVLAEQFAGCDAVINLVGILHEYPTEQFAAVHAELPAKIIEACRAAGVKRLLHMSALHADAENGPSQYLFTKGAGERTVTAAQDLAVTCFKPSIIFAPDDDFFNKFAGLISISPIVPLVCPNSRFAPVYVEDVAQAFQIALQDPRTIGKSYELCGPRSYSLKEIVEDIAQMMGKKRWVVGLPDGVARFQAKIFGLLPIKFFTMDNYLSLQVDSVSQRNDLAGLGIVPRSVEGIMSRHFATQYFDVLRQAARRAT